jgi:hypothetical protein
MYTLDDLIDRLCEADCRRRQETHLPAGQDERPAGRPAALWVAQL